MVWNDEKVEKLKNLWGKNTASQIAEQLGGVSRNAVIGKAHRLNLSAKLKTRSNKTANTHSENKTNFNTIKNRKSKKFKFQSLLLDKNFEPAKNLSLEELTDETCKYMEGHPDEIGSSFCGRKSVKKFSYCPLHLIMIFQPKNKKDDVVEKDELPKFIENKVKSA